MHQLRNDPAFVPELDFVMFLNENGKEGKLIGQNMFMRASIKADDGRNISIMTMGPICIKNEYKRKGKMHHSFCVKSLYRVILTGLPESMPHRKAIL